ncbi:MAG: biotin/lipoyl-binding protein [Chthoniobacterales bacterium]|nr:biotin/lipoyl-binding protein [Chthoniobacterales bacterium]
MKKLRVTVDGKAYEVLVEILDDDNPVPAHASPVRSAHVATAHVAAPETPVGAHSGGSAKAGDIPSPLAGKVVSIDVGIGSRIEANAQLVTLEAMKMNTYIFAPAAGTVHEILVKPGDAVEEGQILVRIS